MQLKYKGKLGYLEARYRLNLGNRDVLLKEIEEVKKSAVLKNLPSKSDIMDVAKEIFG